MAAIPFGLIFLEAPVIATAAPKMIYDESRDLSMIEEEGVLIPAVASSYISLGTMTSTLVSGEDTDVD